MKLFPLLAISTAFLTGCAGLNYNQQTGNASSFHPNKTVILPVRMPEGMELEGQKVGGILTDALANTRVYGNVVDPSTTRNQLAAKENKGLSDNVTSYLSKMITTGVSDASLSSKIGKEYHADTIIVANMDRYGYTTLGGNSCGEVGFNIKVINAETGSVYWRAGHTRQEAYLIFKPDLGEMARRLMTEVISYSPNIHK